MGEIKIPTWAVIIFVACVFLAGYGAHWLYTRPDKAPTGVVIDKPAPVQPDFEHPGDSISGEELATLGPALPPDDDGGGAIDTLTKPTVTGTPAEEKVLQSPQAIPERPCPAFTLHLVSSDSVQFLGLDSTVVFYSYPSGQHFFSYYPTRQRTNSGKDIYRANILSYGVRSFYHTYQSKLDVELYGALNLRRVGIVVGYRVEGNRRPSWMLGIRKEWKIW